MGVLETSVCAAQSSRDELYLETDLEIFSTLVISGAIWLMGSFSELRMVFQESSTFKEWAKRSEWPVMKIEKGLAGKRRRIKWVYYPGSQERRKPQAIEWSSVAAIVDMLGKIKTEKLHSVWKFQFAGLSKGDFSEERDLEAWQWITGCPGR